MDGNGWKWLEMAEITEKFWKLLKLLGMAEKILKKPELAGNFQKYLDIARNIFLNQVCLEKNFQQIFLLRGEKREQIESKKNQQCLGKKFSQKEVLRLEKYFFLVQNQE